MSDDSYAVLLVLDTPNESSKPSPEGYYTATNWAWYFAEGNGTSWESRKTGTLGLPGPGDSIGFYIQAKGEFNDPEKYAWLALDFEPDHYQERISPLDPGDDYNWRRGFPGPAVRSSGGPAAPGTGLSWEGVIRRKVINEGVWTLTVRIHTSIPDPNNPGKNYWFILDPRMCVGDDCEG